MPFTRPQSIPSPCRQICQLDARDVCIGCWRTRHEIGEWSQATLQRQAEILKAVHERRSALEKQTSAIEE